MVFMIRGPDKRGRDCSRDPQAWQPFIKAWLHGRWVGTGRAQVAASCGSLHTINLLDLPLVLQAVTGLPMLSELSELSELSDLPELLMPAELVVFAAWSGQVALG